MTTYYLVHYLTSDRRASQVLNYPSLQACNAKTEDTKKSQREQNPLESRSSNLCSEGGGGGKVQQGRLFLDTRKSSIGLEIFPWRRVLTRRASF